MTKRELSLKIAEKLEPKPTYPDGLYYDVVSIGGFWIRHSFNVTEPDESPLDFFVDEEANALLLDSMPDPTLHFIREETDAIYQFFVGGDKWGCKATHDGDGRTCTFAWHQDRKTAIVMAKCHELGIDYGTIEE